MKKGSLKLHSFKITFFRNDIRLKVVLSDGCLPVGGDLLSLQVRIAESGFAERTARIGYL